LVVGITPKEILNTLGVFPITPKVLSVLPTPFWLFCRVLGLKSNFKSNNLELSFFFSIFAQNNYLNAQDTIIYYG
jgi:hypothetical protein